MPWTMLTTATGVSAMVMMSKQPPPAAARRSSARRFAYARPRWVRRAAGRPGQPIKLRHDFICGVSFAAGPAPAAAIPRLRV